MKRILILLFFCFFYGTIFAQDNELKVPLRTWESEEEREKEKQMLIRWRNNWNQYSLQKKKVTSNLIISAILPGMGQIKCNNWRKGSLFLGSTTLAFGGAFYFFYQSNDRYKKYEEVKNIDEIEKYWNDYSRTLRYSQISAMIGAGIWIINLVDTYFTTKTFNNKNLFSHFYSGIPNTKPSFEMKFINEKINFSIAWEF